MAGKVSVNTGITVQRQIVVLSNEMDQGRTKSRTPSLTSVVHSIPDVRSKTPEQFYGAIPGDMRDDFGHQFAREEGVAGLVGERRQNHEMVEHLIEFLNKTPPSKNNRMSIPDRLQASAQSSKWTKKFNALRNRRGKGKRKKGPPTTITLPDTAVAATTTGGHRHISISIPIEHSYMGPDVNAKLASQRSVPHDLTRELESRLGGIDPRDSGKYSSEKLVGTPLKTVAEDRESITSDLLTATPRSSENPERSTSLRAPPSRVRSESVTSMTDEGLPSSLIGTTQVGTPPAEIDEDDMEHLGQDEEEDEVEEDGTEKSETPRPPTRGIEAQATRKAGPQPVVVLPTVKPSSSGRGRQTGSESTDASNGESSSGPHIWNTSTVPAITFTLPTRKSSKRTGSPASLTAELNTYSIDNMLSASPIPSPNTSDGSSGSGLTASSNSNNGHDHTFGFGLSRFARGSVAESVITTGSEPRVFDAQAAKAYRTQMPIVVRPPSVHSVEVAMEDDDDETMEDDEDDMRDVDDDDDVEPPPTFGAQRSVEALRPRPYARDDADLASLDTSSRGVLRPGLKRSLTTIAISRAAQTDISAHASIQRYLRGQQELRRRKTDAPRPSSRSTTATPPPGVHQLPAGGVDVWPEYAAPGGAGGRRVGDIPSPPHSEKPPSTVRNVGGAAGSQVSIVAPFSPVSLPSSELRQKKQQQQSQQQQQPSQRGRRRSHRHYRSLSERPSKSSTLGGGRRGGLSSTDYDEDNDASSSSLSDPGEPFDPAAYYRRLERRAERDAHRARRARRSFEALAREATTGGSSLATPSGAGGPSAITTAADRMSRQELVRRHEQLREHRMRDMERRLRRLERNGDVWLRSMVPLLESLNRLLEEQRRFDDALAPAAARRAGGTSASAAAAATAAAALGSDSSASSSLPSLISFPAPPSNTVPNRSSSVRGHRKKSSNFEQGTPSRSKSLHYHRQRHQDELSTGTATASEARRAHQKNQSAPSPSAFGTGDVRPWWKAEVAADYSAGAGSGSDYFNFRDRLKRGLGGSKRGSKKQERPRDELSDEEANSTSLEKLEPLMRELQGAARFSMESQGKYHVPGMWEESMPEISSMDEAVTERRGKKQTRGNKGGEEDTNKDKEVTALR